jgi:cytochrome c peroxidase
MLLFPRALAGGLLVASALAQIPPVPVPAANPVTPAKVVLGKILFWDEQLSSDDSVACGTCHLPEAGGADPRAATALHPGPDGVFGTADDVHGAQGMQRQAANGDFALDPVFDLRVQVTRRSAPSNLGAAFHARLFWDGRASGRFVDPETGIALLPWSGALESQAVAPILSRVEMAREGRTWNDVREKLQGVRPLALARNLTVDVAAALKANSTYPSLFAAAFGDPAIDAARIAFALASYQRTLIPDQTPYDAFIAGDGTALTVQQQLGLLLFETTGRCTSCHTEPLFTDDRFHDLGLRDVAADTGRGGVTGVTADNGAFETPSLRNAGLRPRLFHDGQSPPFGSSTDFTDPESVASIYLAGGGLDRHNLDPLLLPLGSLGVTSADMALILDFVAHGLTDPRAALGLSPFDHPTLRSDAAPPASAFGAPFPGSIEPVLLTPVPSFVGNLDWKVGAAAGEGPTPAYIACSPHALVPALTAGLLPLYVGPDIHGCMMLLDGPPGAPALGTWRIPIPDDPSLWNTQVFLQLFAADAKAWGGVAASSGYAFTVQ